jgi:hypothetical protein
MKQPRVQICLAHQQSLCDLLGSQDTRGVRLESSCHLVVEEWRKLPPKEGEQVKTITQPIDGHDDEDED